MEATFLIKTDRMEQKPVWGSLIFGVSWLLNINVWTHNFSIGVKVFLAMIAGITTIMAFFNQWKIVRSNYKGYWIIVKIEHVFTRFAVKKVRHIKNMSYTKKKKRNV